jgi:D-serine deaminase-like pyridoxal phosphate-dependent protein
MSFMDLRLETYQIEDVHQIITPALIIYPQIVDRNIEATLRLVGNDPNRWRPHIKTAKAAAILRRMMNYAVVNFKCATTLELLTACEAGAGDVLVAYAFMGANADRAIQIADQFPRTRISVLVETAEQANLWRGTNIGVFIDINPGMNRTGISPERTSEILGLAQDLGDQFRGLHYYDGQISSQDYTERERQAHEGYDELLELVHTIASEGVPVGEVITSGTPAMPCAMSYLGFRDAPFVHRVSPGTVVYNDTTSVAQLPMLGYTPAALVLATVVSRPKQDTITCDGGHKSVSADAGVPTCTVVGHPELVPLKPSEEHLPIQSRDGMDIPEVGSKLYLVPRHVCPTVNNFDEALLVEDGRIIGVERITARGHERPIALSSYQSLVGKP